VNLAVTVAVSHATVVTPTLVITVLLMAYQRDIIDVWWRRNSTTVPVYSLRLGVRL